MTPKIIWQTYEVPFDQLPQYIKNCAQTWKDCNPEWEYRYMDAKQRDEFVLNNFDKEWYKIFTKLPRGVFKADIWRHMVLSIHGGVYADLDTLCKAPIETWLKSEMNTTYFMDFDYKYFCQFVLSSVPNNDVYKKILDTIKEKILDDALVQKLLNKPIQEFGDHLTGSLVCTEAIRLFLKIPNNLDLINDYEEINSLKTLQKNKFFYYEKQSYKMLHNYPIEHLVGSNNWQDQGYIQWQKQGPIKEKFL
jgi:mannosyltransferase OCH1-like enzyme